MTDLAKAIAHAVHKMQLEPGNADVPDSTLASVAATQALRAYKAGEEFPVEPPPQTFSIARIFPGIEKKFEDTLSEAIAKTRTAENKAKARTYTDAEKLYSYQLSLDLFGLAMEHLAVVGYRCKHTRPLDIYRQMTPFITKLKNQNEQIQEFYAHLDALETRLAARIDSLRENVFGTSDG